MREKITDRRESWLAKTAVIVSGGVLALSACSSGTEGRPTVSMGESSTPAAAAPSTTPSRAIQPGEGTITRMPTETIASDAPNVPPTVTAPTTATKRDKNLPFTFDDLGGGSSSIQVYHGPSIAGADRVPFEHPVYTNGDRAVAECQIEGRSVSSHPEVGETDRTDETWIKIAGKNPPQYATGVYVVNPVHLFDRLDYC
jgi:hypothetical protein